MFVVTKINEMHVVVHCNIPLYVSEAKSPRYLLSETQILKRILFKILYKKELQICCGCIIIRLSFYQFIHPPACYKASIVFKL